MNRRRFVAGGGSLVVLVTAGCTEEVENELFAPSVDPDPRAVEEHIFKQTNEQRTTHSDADPLEYNEQAARKARAHAEDMAAKEYMNHTSLDGETAFERYSFCYSGENIVKNTLRSLDRNADKATAEAELGEFLVERWMDSPGHRENILNAAFESLGVGVAITDDDDVYAVQGFCMSE